MEQAEIKSKKRSNILYAVLAVLMIASIGFTFYKIAVLKDYQIIAQVSCDPKTEKCFAITCDPATDDTCSKNPDEQTSYYKKISKKAASISMCEATADKIGCTEELSCIASESNCFYILCDPANLEDGEQCANQ